MAALALAGCGSSGGSKEDKAFTNNANATCFARLSPVREAADTTKTNAPRDDVLAQAEGALLTSARDLDNMRAPSDKRQAQTNVSLAMVASAHQIRQYLQDKISNEPRTSADWNQLTAQLSELEQTSSGYGLQACALPVS